MPLAFVIVRYFVYTFIAVAAVWLVSFMALSAAINLGWAYEASWGPANARSVAAELAGCEGLAPEDIPTAYRYLIVGDDGTVRTTNLTDAQLDQALGAAQASLVAAPGSVEVEGGGNGVTLASFPLDDGGACVLVCEYLPQWASPELAAALPNPQNLMLGAAVVGSVVALALIARRASRVLARKMEPLRDAAARIGREELDFEVGRSNVREVNDVLAAMDAMRASLAASLEARWETERQQREQVASLAHDLKTPLTILRANADFVAEELDGDRALETDERQELVAAARDISGGAERLDGYVHLLIDASRGAGEVVHAPVSPAELCEQIIAEAGAAARARGIELVSSVQPDVACAPEAPLDRAALARAAANLVANAVEHAREHVEVRCSLDGGVLCIEVADDGTGFSPAALEHGCERLFTDDVSRTVRAGEQHYGLGLFTALEAARAHGGDVVLANRMDGEGVVAGAVVTLGVPLGARASRA